MERHCRVVCCLSNASLDMPQSKSQTVHIKSFMMVRIPGIKVMYHGTKSVALKWRRWRLFKAPFVAGTCCSNMNLFQIATTLLPGSWFVLHLRH